MMEKLTQPPDDRSQRASRHVDCKKVIGHLIRFIIFGGLYLQLIHNYFFSVPTDSIHQCSAADLDTLSCSTQSSEVDGCCVEKPGGLLLLTQIWNPTLGPDNTWGVHGLWPNLCNGSYASHCDPSRDYDDIPALLAKHGEEELLTSMAKVWRNDPPVTTVNGTDADLWAHEWNKHGTCLSTLQPRCFSGEGARGLDAITYFKTTLALSEELSTYEFLAGCGIVPDADRSYGLSEVEACLAQRRDGSAPVVRCDGSGRLNEMWYFFKARGSLRSGVKEWVETSASTHPNCPGRVVYPP